MKHRITYVDDLYHILEKVLQPLIKNPETLINGREIEPLKLRPRELVGNFMLAVVAQSLSGLNWTISTDPFSGDGSIYCKEGERKGEGFNTEHVYVSKHNNLDLTEAVLKAIENKSSRGKSYGENRHLIVFVDKFGSLDLQMVKEDLKRNDVFLSCWIIGKSDRVAYDYVVFTLKSKTDPLGVHGISINDDFKDWEVKFLGTL